MEHANLQLVLVVGSVATTSLSFFLQGLSLYHLVTYLLSFVVSFLLALLHPFIHSSILSSLADCSDRGDLPHPRHVLSK